MFIPFLPRVVPSSRMVMSSFIPHLILRYLPQPCSGTHRLNYVLRTNRTVSMQIMYMNISLWMCVCIKCPELAVIHRRYTIKCSPPSLSSTSLPHGHEPCARGQSRTCLFLVFNFWGKITFFWKNYILIFHMNILYSFFLQFQASLVYSSTMDTLKQWTKFSFAFSAGGGVYKKRLVVRYLYQMPSCLLAGIKQL